MSDKNSFINTTATVAAVAPTTTATLITLANTARSGLYIYNAHATVDCFIGPSSGVTASTGIPLLHATGAFFDDHTSNAWYGITASGTSDLRVIVITAP